MNLNSLFDTGNFGTIAGDLNSFSAGGLCFSDFSFPLKLSLFYLICILFLVRRRVALL